jgi:L-galactose dehydrogenase/L-glyceraldehyde 3-phosphate reductase
LTRQRALVRAVGAGINWIDTAALYGNGKSEAAIGKCLPHLDPRPHVSTKVRIEPDDVDDIPGAIERSLEASLQRLGLEQVTLFQLHNQIGEAVGGRPTVTPEQILRRGGIADTFDRLKAQGLIQACGITALGDTDACLEVIGSGRFDTAQVYYNVINPSAAWSRISATWRAQSFAGIIPACFHQDMGILNIRVWAGGPLARTAPPERLSVMTEGTDIDNEMRCADAVRGVLGDAYGSSAQMALRFVLASRDITTRVIGISQMSDLDDALDAVAKGPLPGEAIAKLERLWATDFWTG